MIIKSQSDAMTYAFKKLPNGIKCLFISSPNSSKSCCSVSVNAGSLDEPKAVSGVAHLVEHMLFMGSKKYKAENDFANHLNDNNGSSNAYTQLRNTNYFFNSSHSSYEKSIDMFSQFFKSPLMSTKSILKEIKAVNSEHEKNLQNDSWRMFQMVLSLSNKDSEYNVFPTGSSKTLVREDIREKLFDFFNYYYTSDRMSICLLSPLSNASQYSLAKKYFGDIRPCHKEAPRIKKSSVEPYNLNNLGNIYKVIPVAKENKIILSYFIPCDVNQYVDSKPYEILSEIINQKLKGSLFSNLFKNGDIRDLYSSINDFAGSFSNFCVEIDLTPQGMKNYEKVMNYAIAYIDKIVSTNVDYDFVKQYQKISRISFDYKTKEEELNYCVKLADKLSRYDRSNIKNILCDDYLVRKIDCDFLRRKFQAVNRKNLNVFVIGRELLREKNYRWLKEKWYRTDYAKEKLKPSGKKERITFKYPKKNAYIPNNFEITEPLKKEKYPQLEFKTKFSSVYFKQDYTFKLPHLYVLIKMNVARSYLSDREIAKNNLYNYIFKEILENHLKEEIMLFNQGGVRVSFDLSKDDMKISVNGFNQHIRKILNECIAKMQNVILRPRREIPELEKLFKLYLQKYLEKASNFFLSSPYSQVLYHQSTLFKKGEISPSQLLSILSNESKDKLYNDFLNGYIKTYFSSISTMDWLVQGNSSINSVKELVKSIEGKIDFTSKQSSKKEKFYSVLQNGVLNIYGKNKKDNNNSYLSYFENKSSTEKSKCETMILRSLLREKYFNDLRTEKGYGYIVNLFSKETPKQSGLCFLVQSHSASPSVIDKATKNFIHKNTKFIQKDLTSSKLSKYVTNTLTNITKKDIALSQEVNRNWTEICNDTYLFNRREHRANALKSITLKDIRNRFQSIFYNSEKNNNITFNFFSQKSAREQFSYLDNYYYEYSKIRENCLL